MTTVPFTIQPNPNVVLAAIWGELKTAKTTLALTFPRPIFYIDLDQGIERAIDRFLKPPYSYTAEHLYGKLSDFNKNLKTPDILVKSYPLPIKWPGLPLQGQTQLWQEIVQDIFAFYTDSRFKTLVIDTGTGMWNLACDSHLQELQVKSSTRKQLLMIEYRRPNAELRALVGGCRTYRKNLVMVHHEGGIYKDVLTSSGNVESMQVGTSWGGWRELGKRVDFIVRTFVADKVNPATGSMPETITKTPSAVIETCGYNLEAEGRTLFEPSYDKLMSLIQES